MSDGGGMIPEMLLRRWLGMCLSSPSNGQSPAALVTRSMSQVLHATSSPTWPLGLFMASGESNLLHCFWVDCFMVCWQAPCYIKFTLLAIHHSVITTYCIKPLRDRYSFLYWILNVSFFKNLLSTGICWIIYLLLTFLLIISVDSVMYVSGPPHWEPLVQIFAINHGISKKEKSFPLNPI